MNINVGCRDSESDIMSEFISQLEVGVEISFRGRFSSGG